MMKILLTVLLTCTTIVGFSSCSSTTDDTKPNILFVFIDDMGYGDLQCFGNNESETPNINRLASEGIRFNQFYVNAPICSPSRTAVTTGQYPMRWGITSYIASRANNKRRGMNDCLSLEAPSVARTFSENGYYTAHIGKWHMGGGRDIADVPLVTEYGFDESYTQFEGLGDRVLATFETFPQYKGGKRDLEIQSEALGRGKIDWAKRYKVNEIFVNKAIKAIENARKVNKPFYINLWPDDVHTPCEPSPENRQDMSKHGRYLGVLKEMDREMGVMFDYIRNDKELAENTLIVFTSDNGPEPGAGVSGDLRGFKCHLYEGGIREPLIIWSPKLVDSKLNGTIDSTSVIAGFDLPPTLLSIAGIKHNVVFDGENRAEPLLGLKQTTRKKPIMWQRPSDRPWNHEEGRDNLDLAIREGDYKLLINMDGSGLELYNIKNDERESNNIAAEYPEIVKNLKKKVMAWNAEIPPMLSIPEN